MVEDENEKESLKDDKLGESENKIEDMSIQKQSEEPIEKSPSDRKSPVEDSKEQSESLPDVQEPSVNQVQVKAINESSQSIESNTTEELSVIKEEQDSSDTVQSVTSSKSKSENSTSNDEAGTEITEPSSEASDGEVPESTAADGKELGEEQNLKDLNADNSEGEKSDAVASTSDNQTSDVTVEESHEEVHLDYSNYTKKQMVQVLESLLKEDDFSQVGRILKEIKKPYDKLVSGERKKAFDTYLQDGGEKDGFEYRFDELDNRFSNAYNKLKERRNQYYNSLEKQKESNLNIKLDLLEKLRELVDSEETGSSIKALKDIQSKWKEVGTIPSSQVKGLWANYNALLDRFYDQRSIYFELKELDRKKNHDLKIDVCERAESLIEQDNIREVIKQLNELHDEFKHIGPVPKEDQEKIWDRFKSASDKIYDRRKEFFDKLKDELKLNEVAKEALVEKVIPFADFESERISDWNSKTKEILAIQKEWEKIGALPKEKAKLINKKFWTSFKSFFNKKGQFFKKIDEDRKTNLELKQKLVLQAEELKESEDFNETSEKLKALQRQWKEIGAVPEKYRNEVFFKFKKACDHFFDRRRSNSGKVEKDYEENLKKKKSLCEELEKMISAEKIDLDRVKAIEEEWSHVGFVPKSSIKSILKRHTDAINALTDQADIPENEKHKMRFSAQFSNMNYGPGAEKLIHKKEGALRRQVVNLENDINLWKNNIDFFASSKNADKLKAEFQEKINKAAQELNNLKDQLNVISNL